MDLAEPVQNARRSRVTPKLLVLLVIVLAVAAGAVVHHHHRYLRLADEHRARSMALRMELRDRKRRPATHDGRRSLIREIHRHEELAVRYDAAAFQPMTGVAEHPSSPICICPICYDR